MLLSSALPLLPPPPTSLLPPLNPSADDPSIRGHGAHHSNPHGGQHSAHARRPKSTINPRGPLTTLSADERQLTQRKLAIAMYGYSWLKPAGCGKTMLGRREEELEREEVERQLREVEMQERMAVEADELDRQAERQAEGDAAGVEERDLDDQVPDADAGAEEEDDQWGADFSEGEIDHDHGMRDLDDDIPSAAEQEENDVFSDDSEPGQHQQSSPQHESWTYDTRRAPSTPSLAGDHPHDNNNDIETDASAALRRIRAQARLQRQAGYQRRPGAPGSDYDVDERDAEAMALAEEMLDEDEMGLAETNYASDRRGHRDNYPSDDDLDDGGRDLDDSVPEAHDDDDGEWEHTDSDEEVPPSSEQPVPRERDSDENYAEEDEDQEMDISILPIQRQQQQARTRHSDGPQIVRSSPRDSPISVAQHQQRHTPRRGAAGRVVSGNAAISSSAAMTRSYERRQLRDGSVVSNSVLSSATAGPSGRHAAPTGGAASGGSGASRRGLRSQTQQTQQSQGVETPQGMSLAGAGLPRTGTLLGTDSSFGMGMSTAGGAVNSGMADFESVDAMRHRHVTQGQTETQVQGQAGASSRRTWLNPSTARRNLFGLSRAPAAPSSTTELAGIGYGAAINNGSGGLFTPEGLPSHSLPVPARRHAGGAAFGSPEQSPEPNGGAGGTTSPSGSESPGRQTRSGRLLAGFARRTGRGQQGGGG